MIREFKKSISAALIAGTLASATVAPVRQANAGIIFLPAGVGIVLLVLGVVYDSLLLVILDTDGSMNQDALEKVLSQKYGFIEDRDVVRALASTIRQKAASVKPDAQGRVSVTLSRDEVLQILAPTGLSELQPEAVENLLVDLT